MYCSVLLAIGSVLLAIVALRMDMGWCVRMLSRRRAAGSGSDGLSAEVVRGTVKGPDLALPLALALALLDGVALVFTHA